MKSVFLAVFLLCQIAFANQFPTSPDPQLTPGQLCQHPTENRYPENIPYCERDVTSEQKREIIEMYDHQLGFSVRAMPRSKFKIDHYIPLCMGGSNDRENLWPQHESIYEITDPLEQEACQAMAEGRLSQKKAVELIKTAKNHLSEVEKIRDYISAL